MIDKLALPTLIIFSSVVLRKSVTNNLFILGEISIVEILI